MLFSKLARKFQIGPIIFCANKAGEGEIPSVENCCLRNSMAHKSKYYKELNDGVLDLSMQNLKTVS